MNSDNTVFHFAATSQPLPRHADGVIAALGCSRFINAPDRLGVGVILGDEPLAAIANAGSIPLDRFQQTLESSRLRVKLQRDGFRVLAAQVREQTLDIDTPQGEPRR